MVFTVQSNHRWSRIGSLQFVSPYRPIAALPTPHLFPVVNFMTGTTPNGGGLWKYLLRELLARNQAVMTPALHFLDFQLTPAEVGAWLRHTVITRYLEAYRQQGWVDTYTAPVLMDSGGYKFIGSSPPNLAPYKSTAGEPDWQTILRLQDAIGGEVYVPLDYPLPPGLDDHQAATRVRAGMDNALSVLSSLCQRTPRPFVYIPCHGRDEAEMERNVRRCFELLESHGFSPGAIGLALGSLVPLRVAGQISLLLGLVRAARNGIPPRWQPAVPIHVFGISGTLIPVLAYLGVDTFDSSSYIQSARSLSYLLPGPGEWRYVPFMTLDGELPCSCPYCAAADLPLASMQQILATQEPHRQHASGLYKSEVYARIALHDLYHQLSLVEQTRLAIKAGAIEELLAEHAAKFRAARPAVELLARENTKLAARLTRVHVVMTQASKSAGSAPMLETPIDLSQRKAGQPPWLAPSSQGPATRYSPDSFRLPNGYAPPSEKRVLLLLPETSSRPYGSAHPQRLIITRLQERLTSLVPLHRVTLSGLFGPVPEEMETERPCMEHTYRLTEADLVQIRLCATRLVAFLSAHGHRYTQVIGYGTEKAYRQILLQVRNRYPRLRVLPSNPRSGQATEMLRREHLAELMEEVATAVKEAF